MFTIQLREKSSQSKIFCDKNMLMHTVVSGRFIES